MKFIYITCNVSMLESLSFLLDEVECADYQVIEQVTARSRWGAPRQNTAVWPGYNSAIVVQEANPEKAEALINEINKMNATALNNGELIAAYMWEIAGYAKVKPVE
ncbi:PG0541 family transporter-associated protein [Proteiniphilum sp. UBA1028]|uniref:PG0541 family transporter-associated protein n=1 Tax=Proteiniphilum sp. UBA1028 TaxID=1947251 RepID=UPI000E82FE4C|nr:PG0541 family transporter-associated protein [Proteiniphilum sp. UBA1028]HBG57680.1 hypothetical protein [Porphyromonadaceae bacterium]